MDHAITGMKFDYLLANPPFGVEWKPQADDILKEAEQKGFDGRFGAGLPIFYERVKPGPPAADFTIIEDDDEEPPGYWYVDTSDKRVKDFPPE